MYKFIGLSAPQRIYTSSAESLSLLRAVPRRNTRGLCSQGRTHYERRFKTEAIGRFLYFDCNKLQSSTGRGKVAFCRKVYHRYYSLYSILFIRFPVCDKKMRKLRVLKKTLSHEICLPCRFVSIGNRMGSSKIKV